MSAISLNIVLDNLSTHQYEAHVDLPSKKALSRVVLLPQDRAEIDPDWVYVCRLSDYIWEPLQAAGVCCICLRDRLRDDKETELLMRDTIVINENMELETLFTEVQDVFFRTNEWIMAMQAKVICSESLQDLLTLSEPIIGNTINISDSALTLLAHTWNITPDDPVTVALIGSGYHPEENLQRFRENKRFEVWDNSSGLIINPHPGFSPYTLVSKVFKFHNTYFAHVVMVCDHKPMSQGLLDLFQMLLDSMWFYMKQEWDSRTAVGHVYDSLLADLLSGELKNQSTLEERAHHAGIPLTGSFQVLKVSCEDSTQVPLGRMALELRDLIPNSWALVYLQQVVVLTHLRADRSREDQDALCRQMNSFLERYDAICASSAKFEHLADLRAAYEGACLASKYCKRIHAAKKSPEGADGTAFGSTRKRIFNYDDNLVFYLLGESESSQAIWQHSVYAQALRSLQQYDKQHGTENLRLLYVYLRCERKATEASQQLHMHRNNVVYHISRIEEILGLSLNDADVRMGLLLSYMMLQLYGFNE